MTFWKDFPALLKSVIAGGRESEPSKQSSSHSTHLTFINESGIKTKDRGEEVNDEAESPLRQVHSAFGTGSSLSWVSAAPVPSCECLIGNCTCLGNEVAAQSE
ncbi:hypothetical protein TNCV_4987721 [Trichonephila clavipes]|nr:hypothetical protein TNCV_4987721 [Trichonephila clavipes]